MAVLCKKLSPTRIAFTYAGEVRDEDIESSHSDCLALLRAAEAQGMRLVMLVDAASSQGMNAHQRKMTVQFAEENADLMGKICVQQAVVLRSAIQRGVLTAITWVKPPPTPLRVFSTLQEAEVFLDGVEVELNRANAS